MDSLRKLRSKVLEKIPVSSDKNEKVRDKTVRYSRSLPLLPPSDPGHIRPTYRGKRPLQPSDIRHPDDLIAPEAFSRRPVYKKGRRPVKASDIRHPMEFSLKSIDLYKIEAEKPVPNSDIMIQFPSPPTHTPSSSISRPSTDSEYRPTRPSTRPAPLDDIYPDLLPPSILLKPTDLAEERRRYNAIEAAKGRKQSESRQEPLQRHRNDSSSSFSRPTVEAYPEAVRRYYQIGEYSVQSQSGLTSHSNYSTQSLGVNARLRDGPTVHRPVVRTASTTSNSGPVHRQRMSSSAPVNNAPMSVPSTLPLHNSIRRQRNASSASANNAPISAPRPLQAHDSGHRHRAGSSASVNNSPISAPKALHAHGSGHRNRTGSSASVNNSLISAPKGLHAQDSGHRNRTGSSASANRPSNSAAAIYRQRMPSLAAASGPPNSISRHPQYQTTAGRRVFKREPHSSERGLAVRSSKESLSEGYVLVSEKVDPTFWNRIPGDTYERDDKNPAIITNSKP